MGRDQNGSVYKTHGAWYLRYYETELRDGKLVRVRHAKRLCTDDRIITKAKVKNLARQYMVEVNAREGIPTPEQLTVAAFWKSYYLPYAEDNHRPSTVDGYKQIWGQFLEGHFGDMTLQEYKTANAVLFLEHLAKKLGRRTVLHVKNLASGIFKRALTLEMVEANPWAAVDMRGIKTKAPAGTSFYSLDEIENIISALVDRVDCQLVMALAFYAGLRPSEIAGLKWEDFDNTSVHIRRAVVRGVVGETKTPESVATIPLVEQVVLPLQLWCRQCGNPSTGWVFQNRTGNPLNLRELTRRVIDPSLRAKGIQWKGLYAGRRGGATALVAVTGGVVAAQGLLRHKSLSTTLNYYKRETPEVTAQGLKLLEAAANGLQQRRVLAGPAEAVSAEEVEVP